MRTISIFDGNSNLVAEDDEVVFNISGEPENIAAFLDHYDLELDEQGGTG